MGCYGILATTVIPLVTSIPVHHVDLHCQNTAHSGQNVDLQIILYLSKQSVISFYCFFSILLHDTKTSLFSFYDHCCMCARMLGVFIYTINELQFFIVDMK